MKAIKLNMILTAIFTISMNEIVATDHTMSEVNEIEPSLKMKDVCMLLPFFSKKEEAMCCTSKKNWQCWKVKSLLKLDEDSTSTFKEDLESDQDSNGCFYIDDSTEKSSDNYYVDILSDRIDVACCSKKRCWGLYETFYR